jgi:hypothetical protein
VLCPQNLRNSLAAPRGWGSVLGVMTAESIGAAKGGGYARYLESKTVVPELGAYYLTPEGEPTQAHGRWLASPDSLLPFCEGKTGEELVFQSESKPGEPISGVNLYRRFLNAAKRAGLPRLRLYELRHTFGTQRSVCSRSTRCSGSWAAGTSRRPNAISTTRRTQKARRSSRRCGANGTALRRERPAATPRT